MRCPVEGERYAGAKGMPVGRGGAWRRVAGLVVVALVFLPACSSPPAVQLPDPASGEFLTLEDQQALSQEQVSAYCSLLNGYLAGLHADLELAHVVSDSLAAVLDSLNAEQSALNREQRLLSAELRRLKRQRTETTEYVTREGDTLMRLAKIFYDTSAEWRKIYNANRDQIADAGAPLPAGLELVIPR